MRELCSKLLLGWEHSRENSWRPVLIVMNEATNVQTGTYTIVFTCWALLFTSITSIMMPSVTYKSFE